MKKLKLFISLWFTMFSVAVFAQAEFEKIAITQNAQDNLAGRLLVQDVATGEIRWILKSVLDNKFNQPTGDATQYLDGAGVPTAFPLLAQSDRVVTEVRNTTGATITKGTVVYLNGASGGKPTIQKAQANAEATSSGTFGVIQSDISNNSNGYAVLMGSLLSLNTSAFTAGAVLWLSPTVAGGFTTTKPVAPNHAVYVGIVTLATTNGSIEVKIQNGYELDELHDVLIVSKTDNDGLIYDAASGLWKNKQITKAMVGLGNVDNTSDANKPISTTTQTALNLKENTANKNTANGYAGLGSDGKLISNQLPAITITDTFVVSSQSAMLALTAETGDVAVRTDLSKSFILKGTNPAVLGDWQELLSPVDGVTSVFGRVGSVTAQTGDYTTAQVTETTNKKYQTDAQALYNDATSSIQTQLNAKATDSNTVHKTGDETIAGIKTFSNLANFSGSGIRINTNGWLTPNQVYGETGNFFVNYSGIGNTIIGNSTGSVGVGTTSPAYKLDVNGEARLNNNLWFTPTSGYSAIGASGTDFNIYNGSGAQTRLTVNASGNVGIGTTSPNYKLDVSGNGRFTSNLTIDSGTTPFLYFSSSRTSGQSGFIKDDGNMVFQKTEVGGGFKFLNSSSTNLLDIGSSGNVGIGTTSPNGKLEVNGSGFTSGLINATMISGGGNVLRLNTNFSGGNTIDLNPFVTGVSNGGFELVQNGTKRLVISDTGNVGIGATAPSANLHIQSTQASLNLRSTGTGSPYIDFYTSTSSLACTMYALDGGGIAWGVPSAERMRIKSTGAVNVANLGTGLVYSNGGDLTSTNPSDERLKTKITDLNYGLNDILKLRPVSYYWKNDTIKQGKQFGFIAQEVQQIMPELVKEFETKEGQRLGLDKEGIYAALVKAVQEQQMQIKELKAEIEILKNK